MLPDNSPSFRDTAVARKLAGYLRALSPEPARFMEVCGTHTVAIARSGIRDLLPAGITLTSGPGCPVCVTATADIDRFCAAARRPDTIITTFGDLIRVPGSRECLRDLMADGADVRIVYSPLDALAIARDNPGQEVIFLGVGFETTAPTIGAAILQADHEKLSNFSVLSAHKTVPPALAALATDPAIRINGLICPGHVSIIIGADAYQPLARQHHIPCVVAGFEPADILQAIIMLIEQREKNEARVEIAYQRAVTPHGNQRAQEILATVFTPEDAEWRGIGIIPGSGLAIRPDLHRFDAARRFELSIGPVTEAKGCACGKVLKGIILPNQCKLFGSLCNPEHPVGPCMVSSEGSCAAYYRYGS